MKSVTGTGLLRTMRMVGASLEGLRAKDDFYATPAKTTEALLRVEDFDGPVWEPCCGEGHMSIVLQKHGLKVQSTDLHNYGYSIKKNHDFLSPEIPKSIRGKWKLKGFGKPYLTDYPNIVTNPPYANALDFARQAVGFSTNKCALLLKLSFLEGQKRKAFFKVSPPSRIHVFSERQSLMKNGVVHKGGMMALAWFVWDKTSSDKAQVSWL